jgi:O-antigen ligase
LLSSVAAALGLVALFLTQSRGGWLGMAVGLAVVAWLLGGKVRWAAIGAGVASLALVAVTPVGGQVTERLVAGVGLTSAGVQVTPENFAVQERLAHWRAGLSMAQRYPLLGVGAGNFSDRFREFTPVWRFRISRGHAHNAYIQAAAQTGYVGLVAYVAFVVTVAAQLWRFWRAASDGAGRAMTAGAIGVSVAFAVHGAFDYLHVLSLPVQLVAAWALASAVQGSGLRPTGQLMSGSGSVEATIGEPLAKATV